MPTRISETVFDEIERLLSTGSHNQTEIAATVGVASTLVRTIAEGRHYYQRDLAKRGSLPKYMPTPEQIEFECARLRAARKPSEVDDPEGWTPPVVSPGTLD